MLSCKSDTIGRRIPAVTFSRGETLAGTKLKKKEGKEGEAMYKAIAIQVELRIKKIRILFRDYIPATKVNDFRRQF